MAALSQETVGKTTEEEKKPKKNICVDLFSLKMGYWDVPQGTDCVEKTWIMTKLGTALGKYLSVERICNWG